MGSLKPKLELESGNWRVLLDILSFFLNVARCSLEAPHLSCSDWNISQVCWGPYVQKVEQQVEMPVASSGPHLPGLSVLCHGAQATGEGVWQQDTELCSDSCFGRWQQFLLGSGRLTRNLGINLWDSSTWGSRPERASCHSSQATVLRNTRFQGLHAAVHASP